MKRIIVFTFAFSLVTGTLVFDVGVAASEEPTQSGTKDAPVKADEDGTSFDPKVDKARLPDGAWYCDMGGVHYARMNRGDQKCELCGMKLRQKKSDMGGHQGHAH